MNNIDKMIAESDPNFWHHLGVPEEIADLYSAVVADRAILKTKIAEAVRILKYFNDYSNKFYITYDKLSDDIDRFIKENI